MSASLSTDQSLAMDSMEEFINSMSPASPYYVLHGLAGTGKTHLMTLLARRYHAAMCAFTGKAASVLRTRTGMDVSTVHSAIYDFCGLADDEEDTNKKRPIFSDKEDAGLTKKLVLLDECSSVGTRLAEDLLNTGARVIACGDPGQVPPVRDSQFFIDPNTLLTEPHRQAWDSAIIRQAHAIRNTGRYAADGDDFRVIDKATENDLRICEIALCWRNTTRVRLNARRREVLGVRGLILREGEPLMCLQND